VPGTDVCVVAGDPFVVLVSDGLDRLVAEVTGAVAVECAGTVVDALPAVG
jgi:hypothetical protein